MIVHIVCPDDRIIIHYMMLSNIFAALHIGHNKGMNDSLIDLIHASNKEYYTHGNGRAGSHEYRLPEGLRRK